MRILYKLPRLEPCCGVPWSSETTNEDARGKKTQRLQGLSYMRMKKLDIVLPKMGLLLDSQKPVLLHGFLLEHFHQRLTLYLVLAFSSTHLFVLHLFSVKFITNYLAKRALTALLQAP